MEKNQSEGISKEDLKALREKSLVRRFVCRVLLLLNTILTGLVIYGLVETEEEIYVYLFLLTISVMLGTVIWMTYTREKYTEKVKTYIVETAAEGMFDSFRYQPGSGFFLDDLHEARMMLMKELRSDDLMTGEYNDISFRRADVFVPSSTLGMELVQDDFNGSWTVFKFPKEFSHDLQVTSWDLSPHSRVNRGFFTPHYRERHLFKTGDEAFDEVFICSAQDETEAMTLLTPTVRKRMVRIYWDSRLPMIFGWKDNELHFITKNAIAPSGIKLSPEPDLDSMVKETKKSLFSIRRVIEELIMSRSIFSEYALEQYRETGNMQNEDGYRRQ
ncbi:MAG: DUF3137 domain-containing protein [Lachnospiraceae bacterium]|nr:DUF3137 domain-containing protein [Lachnospiraceae bacterium]